MMTCEAIGCPHPSQLPLTWSQLVDWHAYFLFRLGSERSMTDSEKIDLMTEMENRWNED